MVKNISIGFVIHNPEINFLERLKKVVAQDYVVFIFDNTPAKSDVREFSLGHQQIKYLTIGKNVGLGYGIASVCAQSHYSGNAALLFFDQDTVFNLETLDFIEDFYLKNLDLACDYSAIVFNSKGNVETSIVNCFRDVDLIINSGSLFFLNSLSTLGWHNINYFVDCVDYEFCLTSSKFGFKIGEYICTPGYDHASEQADYGYQIFGKEYALRAYPIFRIYDTVKASAKLIVTALFAGKLKFSLRLCRLVSIYMVVQVLTRTLKPIQKI